MHPREQAIAIVRAQLGLESRPPSDWSYNERTAYNVALADYIAANRQLFSASEVATADEVRAKDYAPLEDTGWDWGLFTSELDKRVTGTMRGLLSFWKWAVFGGALFLIWQIWRTDFAKPSRAAK